MRKSELFQWIREQQKSDNPVPVTVDDKFLWLRQDSVFEIHEDEEDDYELVPLKEESLPIRPFREILELEQIHMLDFYFLCHRYFKYGNIPAIVVGVWKKDIEDFYEGSVFRWTDNGKVFRVLLITDAGYAVSAYEDGYVEVCCNDSICEWLENGECEFVRQDPTPMSFSLTRKGGHFCVTNIN